MVKLMEQETDLRANNVRFQSSVVSYKIFFFVLADNTIAAEVAMITINIAMPESSGTEDVVVGVVLEEGVEEFEAEVVEVGAEDGELELDAV